MEVTETLSDGLKREFQIQVPAAGPYPSFYDRTGPPQIAIIVCSGKRTAPGFWTMRTIWYASPVA